MIPDVLNKEKWPGILLALEPVLEGAIAMLKKVVYVTVMEGKRKVGHSNLLQVKTLMKECKPGEPCTVLFDMNERISVFCFSV